jgi:hypothetical protein
MLHRAASLFFMSFKVSDAYERGTVDSIPWRPVAPVKRAKSRIAIHGVDASHNNNRFDGC